MKAGMWTTATSGKFTNNTTLTMKNMFVGTCKNYYFFGTSILGDPAAVSWVRKNGGERFSSTGERVSGMLFLKNQFHDLFECLSVIWQKKKLCPTRGQHLSRSFRNLVIRRSLPANSTVHVRVWLLPRGAFFSENGAHKTKGAFHSTKIPVWNFGISTSPMDRYTPVAQTRPKPPRVWLLFL